MTLLYIEQYNNVFTVHLQTSVPLNAWQGRVVLPADIQIQNVSYGGSIGDVWQEPPMLSGAAISFVGGRTTAFTGDGTLFSFTAVPGPVASAELISFDPVQTALYLANGQGTKAAATLQPITVNARLLAAASSSAPSGASTIPAPFTITAVQDTQIFNGQPAIIFSTTDAGSGIDHYEVEEYTQNGTIGWHSAASPYLVDPKTTMIMVKAVDRAGNSRVESIAFPGSGPSVTLIALWVIILLVIGLAATILFKRWSKKSSRLPFSS